VTRTPQTDFERAHAAARAAGAPVNERSGEVTFIENVSAHDADLAARAVRFAPEFGAPHAWFDAVRTFAADGGIGAHFDHSDNFVLQQSGVKEWTLASPRDLDPADIARRMMNVPDVGVHDLPQSDTTCFRLEAGDLLYIPLFWIHSGVSEAGSLSLSLVCPAVSLYSAVMPFLARSVKARAIGHQPIHAFHAHLTASERQAAARSLRLATRSLLEHLADDELLSAVSAMQAESLPGIAREGGLPAARRQSM
jgi:50S ribosomal protein L16 3-hydroxylase